MEVQAYCTTCGRGHRVILIAMSSPACRAEITVKCEGGNHLPAPASENYKRLSIHDQAERV